MNILLTGFEPFGGNPVNPSCELAELLGGEVLPVSAARLGPALESAVRESGAEAVIMMGLAENRIELSIERVAINVLDFRIPDNDGQQPRGVPIVPGGPDAYLSDLPVREIEAVWRAGGIPGSVSNTAGTFCCNQVLYLARRMGLRAGFIHLPPLEVVPIDVQLQAVRLAMDVAAGRAAG